MLAFPGRPPRYSPSAHRRINWSDPITHQLSDLWLFADGDLVPRNLVTGVAGVASEGSAARGYADYPSRVFLPAAAGARIDNAVIAQPSGADLSVWALYRPTSNAGANSHDVMSTDLSLGVARWRLDGGISGANTAPNFRAGNTAGTAFSAGGVNTALGVLLNHGGYVDHAALKVGNVLNGRVIQAIDFTGSIRSDHPTISIGMAPWAAGANGRGLQGHLYIAVRWSRALRPEEWLRLGSDPWCLLAPPLTTWLVPLTLTSALTLSLPLPYEALAVPLVLTVPMAAAAAAFESASGSASCGRALTPFGYDLTDLDGLVVPANPAAPAIDSPGTPGAPVTLAMPASCGRTMTSFGYDLADLIGSVVPADPATPPIDSPGVPDTPATPAMPADCGRGMTPFGYLPAAVYVAPIAVPPDEEIEVEDPNALFAWYGWTMAHSYIDEYLVEVRTVLIVPYDLPAGATLASYGATGMWTLGGLVLLSSKAAFIAGAHGLGHIVFDRYYFI